MTAILLNQDTQPHGDAGMPPRSLAAGGRSWVRDLPAIALLVGSGVGLRLACQDLPNFAPVAALALFAGYYFRSARLALCVPLAVMGISDWFVGGYHWGIMAAVYATLAFPVLLRSWLQRTFVLVGRRPSQRLAPLAGLITCSLLSSILFFVVTNLAVWAASDLYPLSWSGLAHCYAAAVPFARYTLAGDLFFAVVLFGTYALSLSATRHPVPAGELS